ncbi:general secretion pathway protein [Cupriavidus basilensis]|uniref:General secretion pathway protein n=1 Tax=Cupriavidus basilensis TaxID=68895 RepID=A0ABT6B3K7_9BURK|nr:type II secretion system protein N [Cupriavidus basilensis]MDF3839373.1 general secretion pathway protein [Cupriavidus basilensis]
MQLSLRPALRFNLSGLWLPRLAGLLLFVALCALATRWVLAFSAMKTIPLPGTARVAQTEAVETGAAGTLFGGNVQSGVRDVQLIGVVADIGSGAGAAIVSLDGGPPKAVRAGTALSPQIRLTEIRDRGVVIERNGVRQEIALPVPAIAVAGAAAAAPALPAGAAAPLSTPMPVPAVPVPAPPPQSQSEPLSQPVGGASHEPMSAKD